MIPGQSLLGYDTSAVLWKIDFQVTVFSISEERHTDNCDKFSDSRFATKTTASYFTCGITLLKQPKQNRWLFLNTHTFSYSL